MRLVHNSLHDEVAAQLRERIFSGELMPGMFLDEVQLAEQMKISRTPLREALKVLTAEGPGAARAAPRLLRQRGHRAGPGRNLPGDRAAGGRCAFEAAQHATDGDLAALEDLHDKLSRHAKAKRINEYYATNFAIHEAIIALAGNRWLAGVIGDLRKIVKLARLQQLHAPAAWSKACRNTWRCSPRSRPATRRRGGPRMRTHLTRQRSALRELARSHRPRLA
jgi:DNA-binding GntR family transcriptional regulator